MAVLILGSAERQLIELLRGSEPDKLHLTIHRFSLDGWEIEMSFEARNKDDRTRQRIDRGAGDVPRRAPPEGASEQQRAQRCHSLFRTEYGQCVRGSE